MSAIPVASVDAREVVRCLSCNLTQFVHANNLCRRCHVSLAPKPEPEPTTIAVTVPPLAQPVILGATIKTIRLRRGWSQSEFGSRIGCPRTYISKLETLKVTPTLHSLEKLARGLEVTIAGLLGESENRRANQIRDLVADPYLVEMLPFTSKLDWLQLQTILVRVGQMVARPRRTA